jgi:hypothetical protein
MGDVGAEVKVTETIMIITMIQIAQTHMDMVDF